MYAPATAAYEYCAWQAVAQWDAVCAGTFEYEPPAAAFRRRLDSSPSWDAAAAAPSSRTIDDCSKYAICTLCTGASKATCDAVINRAYAPGGGAAAADRGYSYVADELGGVAVEALLGKAQLCP